MFFPSSFSISATGGAFPHLLAPFQNQKTNSAPKIRRVKSQEGPKINAVKAAVDPFQPMNSSMRFSEAGPAFLQSLAPLNDATRVQFISPRTHRDLGEQVKTLTSFFGDTRLEAIHPGHLVAYQKARAIGDGFTRWTGSGKERRRMPSPAGAAKINTELGLLRRILIAACAWTAQMQQLYIPLQEIDNDLPKALSQDEERRFLGYASSMKEAEVIWWYSLVALHTCFSSDEMRTIRQGDINLTQGILGVNRRHGKNRIRRREVQITDEKCVWALRQLLRRAAELAGEGPHLYLFPRRIVRNRYDGTLPVSSTGLRKQFEAVRDLAGVPWFCINGWRHTAITRMAEAGVPIAVIQRRAGHVSPKMTDHYTHISEQIERQEMMRMGRSRSTPIPTAREASPNSHAL